jgi:hypothetical protein
MLSQNSKEFIEYNFVEKFFTNLTPVSTEKKSSAKAPEPIYRLYFRCWLRIAQGSWSFNFFYIRMLKGFIFASDILNSRILFFSSWKYSEKSKVYYITWYTVTVVITSYISYGIDAQGSGLRHRSVRFGLYIINHKLFSNRSKILMKKSRFFMKNSYFPYKSR